MLMPVAALVLGLALLVWSAGRFVDGSACAARHLGMPALLVGMIVVGFGTSAPEMLVSAQAAFRNNAGMAIGNAYGSNITNIALILGLTALVRPVSVRSGILRKELPILTAATFLAVWFMRDARLTRPEALALLAVFGALLAWSLVQGRQTAGDSLGADVQREMEAHPMPFGRAVRWVLIGLLFLILSSRIVLWGAIEMAQRLGVSDLVTGLTVLAVGTSLPELAASLIAARKGEHDIALGNILGSNLFNTLAVVGIAGAIRPLAVESAVFVRDTPVMAALTVSIFAIGWGRPGSACVNRLEGGLLLACYAGYTAFLIDGTLGR